MKKKKSSKQKWQKPELTRVKLNPEQAVLSCCDLTGRGQVTSNFLPDILQCVWDGPVCGLFASSHGPTS
ncbi:MAG: hypothetical protein PHP69_03865 [Candidatus Omnitrophica bacterium]|nr:hypothetical protein [Candidatus Omnitrophota bacterium]